MKPEKLFSIKDNRKYRHSYRFQLHVHTLVPYSNKPYKAPVLYFTGSSDDVSAKALLQTREPSSGNARIRFPSTIVANECSPTF